MNSYNKFLVFALVLFIGLGVACAAGVDDASVDDTTDSSSVSEVVSETSMDSGNLLVEDDVGDNTDPGANPTQYDSIEERTYNNSIITLSGDQSFTDGVATFGSNVTLTSDDTTRTLSNLKIVVSGSNVTINNVIFNHQTSTPTKVIDVTNGASNVFINGTDITLTKNSAVTTMAVNIDNNANNVVVNNSSITVNGAAQTLWHQDENNTWYDELMISGVNIDRASNVNIANSTVKMINTTDTVTDGTTMPAVTVKNTANNVIVANNTINSTGATYVYGVMCNDYVSSINISGNKINVTGEIYTAGIDASTSINSYVYENKIIANTTNYHGFGYRQEALAYGVILATYQTGNSNNNASYNNIMLIANVGYGIENYMGSNNKIDYNNITIDAKRGLGIATNASNGNYYRNNKINITCNQDAINVFDEAIPAQNVGIIVINGSSNTISNNHINITETSTTSTTYAIKLDSLSSSNMGYNNELYVYNSNGISKQSNNAISNSGTNNYVYAIVTNINSLNSLKMNFKGDINEDEINIINITDSSIETYTINQNGIYKIYAPYLCDILFSRSVITIVDTYLPYVGYRLSRSNLTFINSTFLYQTNSGSGSNVTFINSSNAIDAVTTFVMSNEARPSYGPIYYNTYFDTSNNMLLNSVPDGATIVIRKIPGGVYNNPMIINKPINITSFNGAIYTADITFVSGSEGSNITNMVLNGNLYINTSGITVKNNTITKGVIINEGSAVIEENVFNTEYTAIVLNGAIQSTIQNNNITTASEYTITLDADSMENTISGNNLQAASLSGVASVHDEGEDNTITDGGDEPVIVEPVLKVDTTEFNIGETTAITASIYLGDEVATDINGGKVVFKVDGKTLKDANGKVIYAKVINGTATIASYEIPTSWNKENVTITAVYSGSSKQDALRSEEAQITITQPEPTITTDDIMTTTGETVQLKAKVSIADNPITTGKVVFKVNGKTVKDANGKVIYAAVDETGAVSVNYTIPENMKAGDYVITVTYTSAVYGKLTSNATLTVSS